MNSLREMHGGTASVDARPSTVRMMLRAVLLTALLAGGCATTHGPPVPGPTAPAIIKDFAGPLVRVLDGFDSIAVWKAAPSDGVSLALSADSGFDGRAMRMDVDFHGGGGYAVAHRALPLDLPENYEISFRIRGTVPPNNLEFKLIDSTGDNVWWVNRRDFVFSPDWTRVVIRKRDVQFAWGPLGGGDLMHVAALEFAVTAGSGGKGSVWIDELDISPREPIRPYDATPAVTATSSAGGSAAGAAMDGDSVTAWRSGAGETQSLTIDFQRMRELGGLTVDWDAADFARFYEVRTSADGERWEKVYNVANGDGRRDHIYLPDTEARLVRLDMAESSRRQGYAVREIAVKPLEWSATRNDFFAHVAADAPRGDYPRYLLNQQSYWTVVGVDSDSAEALLNEDGAIETGKSQPSLEPFVRSAGRLVTWADVRTTQSLAAGYLPIPSVHWTTDSLALTVTAFAAGEPGASSVYARYRLENRGKTLRTDTLYLAVRPFQVNPSWQFLNTPGGVATLNDVGWTGDAVTLGGSPRIYPLTRPAAFGAATFDQGGIVSRLRRGELPAQQVIHDETGGASAALAYPLTLRSGEARDVWIAVPLHATKPALASAASPEEASASAAALMSATERAWAAKLNVVRIGLPPSGREIADAIRSNLAYVLINRDGAGIQPGSRSYERSWIRDGSLTSAALLRLGHADAARDFADWYARYQYPSGKVPCCVDRRGADPVPENDSHGELIYLVAETARHTGDRAFLERMWPHVKSAVAYIDSLHRQRTTAEYRAPEKRAFYGLLPQSISHEGYSAKPQHSYWDDFFALRGLKDAAWIATTLHKPEAARFALLRDEFRADLLASLPAAMRMHGIDYLPGSVELGDFDATSTTAGVSPAGELNGLPRPALERTFEKYWEHFTARRDGRVAEEAYTPYEWRVVGSMLRLGWKQRALEVADFFLRDRRPAGWNEWAEVVWRDPRAPKFIGDMPHTWVGSDFIRSALDMFAYETDADDALVIGSGIPANWVNEAPGVSIHGLSTHFGPLGYTMRATGSVVRVRFDAGLRTPPAGIVIRSPLDAPIRSATADGRPVRIADGRELRLPTVPRTVEMRY
ncbi:MAG TPA: discoidin domain-containing protein [Longimicrobiaceae bacterium]|jgi:hypothetical protein|nr:discoidin domain-containing protein [Longimicrobiaceae bacterium]